MTARERWTVLLKGYWAPAAIGAVVGAVGTLAAVVPQSNDKAEQVIELQRRLSHIERDMSAYSRAIRKMYPLLSEQQMSNLFEGRGKFLFNLDRGRTGDDSLVSAELRKSPEGAYFVWCRTGTRSKHRGASFGFWLTRGEAMAWVAAHASPREFRAVFDEDGFKAVHETARAGLCD